MQHSFKKDFLSFLNSPNILRSLLTLALLFIVAFFISKIVAKLIVKLAQLIAVRSDQASSDEKKIQLRRVETYLSVINAVVRAIIIGVTAFYAWQVISPTASLSAATIGASTFFIVIAGATIGILLRDITAGAVMVAEQWYNVGDYVRLEPFSDITGVVEKMSLRSTKLRSLNGEVIWVHNQHIQAAKTTPRGLRTIAIDLFVNNEKVAQSLIGRVVQALPVGTMTVAQKPVIQKVEKWSDYLWLVTVVGQTPPGREWLLENYFVESLKELDAKRRGPNVLVRPPLVRFADPAAERSFKRAVRVQKQNNS